MKRFDYHVVNRDRILMCVKQNHGPIGRTFTARNNIASPLGNFHLLVLNSQFSKVFDEIVAHSMLEVLTTLERPTHWIHTRD
jgi:hypothetical protein